MSLSIEQNQQPVKLITINDDDDDDDDDVSAALIMHLDFDIEL